MLSKSFRKKFRNYYKPYWYLAALRILLVFLPQTGYIHPDEFFQTIEIHVGKFFEVEAVKPWEFKTTFPVRSITLPYIILGTSYKFLKIINFFTTSFYSQNIINPYTLVLFPRLLICALSFLIDWSLYKICVNNNEKYKSRLLILATSYVILIFGTRSFTNTFEMILFSLLLYFVADSMTFSNIIVKQQEYLNRRYEKCKNKVEKAKFHKLRLFLTSHNLRNWFFVSTITVIGFFNRPTFLGFAVFPIFFWLYRGLGFKSVISLQFHVRSLVILLGAIPTILLFIITDSLYFGYLSLAEVEFFSVTIDNFVFTPLNFLKYNINPDNLAEHGLHPKYLHFFINIPILFNVLGVAAILGTLNLLYKLSQQKYNLLPSVRSIKGLMTASFLTPIVLLSIFPHQEPRFLIPVIIPIIYLYANDIYQEPELGIVKMSKGNPTIDFIQRKLKEKSFILFKLWIIFNVVLGIFFGFIHQGGILNATSYLTKEFNSKSLSDSFYVYTSHIYSIPESLFLQRSTEKIYFTSNSKFAVNKRVNVLEEGSKPINILLDKVNVSLKILEHRHHIYLVFPNSLRNHFDDLVLSNYTNINLNNCEYFYPHITTEALPDVVTLTWLGFDNFIKSFDFANLLRSFAMIVESFSLAVCHIK